MLKVSFEATPEQLAVCGEGKKTGNCYDIAILVISDKDDVYLTIDTIYDGSSGIRMDVANGTRFEFGISGAPDLDTLKRDLAPGGRAHELVEEIIAGWTVEWDGGNLRGWLNEEARYAMQRLDEHFSEYTQSSLMAFHARDWLFHGRNGKRDFFREGGYSLDMSEKDLDNLAQEMFEEARSDDAIIIGGASEIRDTLRAAIDDLREEDAEAEAEDAEAEEED